jgi:hypothetical protein
MNNEKGESRVDDDDDGEFDDNDEFGDTVVLKDTDFSDTDDDNSTEINVEALIADFEGTPAEVAARKKEIRRRLEEMAEDKSFEDTYAIDFDD